MLDWINEFLSFGYWEQMLNEIRSLGMFAGVGLAMLEAFFPPLPLVVFVGINVAAFGFWLGYFYSWLGSSIGSIIVFLLIKKFGQKKFQQRIAKNEKIYNIFHWIKEKGFTPIFFLLTFPFTPSIIVCGLAALVGTRNKDYFSALILGKLVMIFSLSFIGFNLQNFIEKPMRSGILILSTLVISLIGKQLLKICEHKRRIVLEKNESKGAEAA
ncbi:TVP38/TMEM64 family protein [Vallitalea pronyensis]|uniref:TVP38/TMEM64 family membrane protein n=1 Tax=Vallitalea pronyensis TaxID=1348613 RepID=A0A8J8SGS5_9FIRM|nr:TVP38/TMEM64 family protein [Vallitalea pronyensis]QUI22677.1 TVP38/TMEM64 family protein [Vallitalea pronyensis]